MTGGEPSQADLPRSPWRQYRKFDCIISLPSDRAVLKIQARNEMSRAVTHFINYSDSILSLPSDRAVLKIQFRNEMSRAVTHPAGESKSLFLCQKIGFERR